MLHHYIIVRRDLPAGVALAQVAHAAGESFYTFAQRNPGLRTARCAAYFPDTFQRSSDAERRIFNPEVATSQVAAGANPDRVSVEEIEQGLGADQLFDASRTVVVVLGARNEYRLLKLASALRSAGIAHVVIREVDGAFAGEVTALGIEPAFKDRIAPLVKDFHMFPADGATETN